MRSNTFTTVGLGLILALTLTLPSCGDDDSGEEAQAGSPSRSGSGGRSAGGNTASGGAAGSVVVGPVACGDALCDPLSIPTAAPVPACCADEASSQCGLDTSVLSGFGAEPTRACEPRDQEGELDEDCPPSEPFQTETVLIPPFPGCCSAATGRCGYLVNNILSFIEIGLGCVDSAPFLDGATPPSCDGSPGSAGSTGDAAGGAPSGAGGAGAD